MKAAGWKVYCLDAANVFHHEGACRQRDYRTLWVTTVAFHRGVYRYYRKHINPRRYDPTHLLVMAGLAMRGAIVLTSRGFKLLRNGVQTNPEPRQGAGRPADSRISS
jgi:hypothetical protein